MVIKFLFIIFIILLIIIAIVLIRTMRLKPTSAIHAKAPIGDPVRNNEYGEKLSKMIQCETISCRDQDDRSKFYKYHEVLKELFPNVWANCEYHHFNGSLLLKWKGRESKDPILFMSHLDVVSASDGWDHEPFSGKIIDGNVWGRGTVDTKGSFFCLMQAAEEMIRDGYMPKTDVYLAGSCTEEWSGDGAPATVAWLKEQGVHLRMLIDEGGMIIEEPINGVKGMFAMVGVLEKGYGDVKFIAKGKGGHASAPGKNTSWARLAGFIQEVEKKNPFRLEINPTVREMFKRMTPNMEFKMRLLFANLWLFEGLLKKLMPVISPVGAALMQTTLAFTKGEGSQGYNVLPLEAYVTGNMRFIPHQGTDESIELISNIAKKYDIETEVIIAEQPCEAVSYKSAEFTMFEEAVHKFYPDVTVTPYVMTGGTDAKYYKDICDNCLRFAPLYITEQQYKSIHAKNENISLATLPSGVDFYKEIIKMQ